MTRRPRRNHSPGFKAKVAWAALIQKVTTSPWHGNPALSDISPQLDRLVCGKNGFITSDSFEKGYL
jgi:hypothetical protein